MSISRRNVLKLASGTAALWATGLNPLGAAEGAGKKIPIGLQLYSVRDVFPKDVPGTLAAIAKMGYQGVEFAGYFGNTAERLSKILDDCKLKCCGTHTAIETLLGDRLKETVEFNKTLGNAFLIVPSLSGKYMGSAAAIEKTARLLSELAAQVKPQGMHVGYHGHAPDFRKIDGQTAWDRLFSAAGPDVVMQLDVGNCLDGGGDPVAELKKFPGRSLSIHIKEHGGKRGAPIGEGTVKWDEIFHVCETTGGTQWYILEQEEYGGNPLDSVKQCIDNMRKMGK
jgi:sugar phosphate isomerase/epimerase